MTLRIPRKQIGVIYSDTRGRITRSDQKLDNLVKATLEDQFDVQDAFNSDLAQLTSDTAAAAAQALAASSAASVASGQALTASGLATTASSQALAASTAASSASSAAAAASSQALSASTAATTASSQALTAQSAANAAQATANAAQASLNGIIAGAIAYLTAAVGVGGRAFAVSPVGGLVYISHGYNDPSGSGTYPANKIYCQATPFGAQGFDVSIIDCDSFTLTLHFADPSGTSISGGSYSVNWRVCGA